MASRKHSKRAKRAVETTQPKRPTVASLIETERRRLQKVSAVLACLVFAANHDAEIDAGDVASAARELVDQAVIALDRITLAREVRNA